MTVIGSPRSFHKSSSSSWDRRRQPRWLQKASRLSVEVANVRYFEGGSLIPNKSPGASPSPDVTLERGATRDRPLRLVPGRRHHVGHRPRPRHPGPRRTSLCAVVALPRKPVKFIVQRDRDRTHPAPLVALHAWPVKFIAGEWDSRRREHPSSR